MKKIKIFEMGPRDGLQSIKEIISSEKKIQLINLLQSTGLMDIEVGSFVSPKWVPQMADSKIVYEGIEKKENINLNFGVQVQFCNLTITPFPPNPLFHFSSIPIFISVLGHSTTSSP